MWELWGALVHGGHLVVPDHALTRSTVDFHRLVRERGVTVLCQTPSAFYRFIEADRHVGHAPTALRRVILAGEALDLARLRPWVDHHGTASPQLVNMYGITETTVHTTHRVIGEAYLAAVDGGTVASPVGGPIAGLATHLLDERLAPTQPRNDGRQTPYRGHPVFVAQHATATCCRTCLSRWHGIPAGHALTEHEREYVVEAICRWIVGEYAPTTPPE